MKYSVSEVAKVMGLTPGALHYYEREGLLTVNKDKNGHRYYDDAIIWRLLSYEKYHTMEYPIKTVIDQFTGGGLRGTIEQRVRKCRDEALSKSKYYRQLASFIQEHVDGLSRIDSLLNNYAFERSPDTLFWNDPTGGWMSKSPENQLIAARWVKAMPASRLSLLYPIRDYDDMYGDTRALFGYSMYPQQVKLLGFELSPDTKHFREESCLRTVVTTDHDFVYSPHTAFKNALEYARSRGFSLNGMPWGKILLVETDPTGLFRAYIELWVPIK